MSRDSEKAFDYKSAVTLHSPDYEIIVKLLQFHFVYYELVIERSSALMLIV